MDFLHACLGFGKKIFIGFAFCTHTFRAYEPLLFYPLKIDELNVSSRNTLDRER
jgi:hypothetical protein